jgi:hypothetical protein
VDASLSAHGKRRAVVTGICRATRHPTHESAALEHFKVCTCDT